MERVYRSIDKESCLMASRKTYVAAMGTTLSFLDSTRKCSMHGKRRHAGWTFSKTALEMESEGKNPI